MNRKGTTEEQLKDWIRRWPNHCTTCFGAGQGPVYYGGSYLEPPEGPEPCEGCIGSGFCPRCGTRSFGFKGEDPAIAEEALEDEHWTCEECGWTAAAPDGIPSDDGPTPEDFIEPGPIKFDGWARNGTLPGTSIPIYEAPRLPDVAKADQAVVSDLYDRTKEQLAEDPIWKAARAFLDCDTKASVLAELIRRASTVRALMALNAFGDHRRTQCLQDFALTLTALKVAFDVPLDPVDRPFADALAACQTDDVDEYDAAADAVIAARECAMGRRTGI